MSKVRVSIPQDELICDGKQVSFRSPCDCANLEVLEIQGSAYQLVDPRGIPVNQANGEIFKSGSIISVLIDKTKGLAYIQSPALPTIELVRW